MEWMGQLAIHHELISLGFKLDVSYMYYEHYHGAEFKVGVKSVGLPCIVCKPYSAQSYLKVCPWKISKICSPETEPGKSFDGKL